MLQAIQLLKELSKLVTEASTGKDQKFEQMPKEALAARKTEAFLRYKNLVTALNKES